MLETNRLMIRKMTKEDAPFVLSILNTDYANKYNATENVNEAIIWKMIEQTISYVIILKNIKEPIGIIGVERDYLRYDLFYP